MTIITPDDRAAEAARAPGGAGTPQVAAAAPSTDEAGFSAAVDLAAVVAAVCRSRPDVPVELVRAEVDQAAWGFRDATIVAYLPVLIERRVRLHLRLEWPPASSGT